MSYSLLSPKMISFVSFPQASQPSMNLYCIYISELVYCPFVLCLVSKALCQPSVRKVISFVLVSSLKPVYRELKKKKKLVEATLIVTFAPVYFAEKVTSTNLKTRNLPQENNGSALSFKIGFQQRFSKHYSSFHCL